MLPEALSQVQTESALLEGGNGSLIDANSISLQVVNWCQCKEHSGNYSFMATAKKPTLINFIARDIWLLCKVVTRIFPKTYSADI